MGCRTLEAKTGEAVMYDSTAGTCFGPVFRCIEAAEEFLQDFCVGDPRNLDADALAKTYSDYLVLANCRWCSEYMGLRTDRQPQEHDECAEARRKRDERRNQRMVR